MYTQIHSSTIYNSQKVKDFPGSTVDGNLPVKAEDTGLIPGLGRFHVMRGNSASASA